MLCVSFVCDLSHRSRDPWPRLRNVNETSNRFFFLRVTDTEGSPNRRKLVRNQSEGSPKPSAVSCELRRLVDAPARKRHEYGVIGAAACMGDHKVLILICYRCQQGCGCVNAAILLWFNCGYKTLIDTKLKCCCCCDFVATPLRFCCDTAAILLRFEWNYAVVVTKVHSCRYDTAAILLRHRCC